MAALFPGWTLRAEDVEEVKEQCMMGQKGSWVLRASVRRYCSSDKESTWNRKKDLEKQL